MTTPLSGGPNPASGAVEASIGSLITGVLASRPTVSMDASAGRTIVASDGPVTPPSDRGVEASNAVTPPSFGFFLGVSERHPAVQVQVEPQKSRVPLKEHVQPAAVR